MTPALSASLRVLLLGAVLPLTACATLPESGPSTGAILHGGAQAAAQGSPYHLVDLTAPVAARLNAALPKAPPTATGFASLPPAAPLGRIGPGDLLNITLWEPNPTGTTLLSPPGLQVSLNVDPSGLIDLPYVGPLRVAGHTPLAIEQRIMAALKAQGHDIQAAVLDAKPVSGRAIVAGSASRPGAYPLEPGSQSLLDVIALAGGSRLAEGATLVRLQRGAAEAKAPLANITANPTLDIALQPGDTVTLAPLRRAFYAFGAVNHPGLFPYDRQHLTLVQALAQIAGLQDNLAAPRGVFIYRPSAKNGAQPTIYRLDLSQPQSFFVAGQFVLHPNDIIYVSDAPIANVSKVLQTISGVSGIAGIPRNFGAPY